MKHSPAIRADVEKALRAAFPGSALDFGIDPDESYWARVCEGFRDRLARIKNAIILHERDWSGEMPGLHRSAARLEDDDWGSEGVDELSSSYHLFFFGVTAPGCQLQCHEDSEDEAGKRVKVQGLVNVGCSVAVSLLAQFAILKLDELRQYDDGCHTCPDIDRQSTSEDADDHWQELWGREAYQQAVQLRDAIATLLATAGIMVLPESECRKPVPWLKPGDDVFITSAPGEPVTVADAMFFRMP